MTKILKSMLFTILVFAFFVVAHEYTHSAIYGYFGCQKVRYGQTWTMFYTVCADEQFVCSDTCQLAHSNNEIVGYTVMPFVLVGLCVYLNTKL